MNKDIIKVLSFDGGGMRGYGQICFLQKIVKQILNTHKEIETERDFFSNFDIMAGTSIGGILALGLAFGMKLEEIETIFLEKGKRIFTTRRFSEVITGSIHAKRDSKKPKKIQKLLMLLKGIPFYQSKHSDSDYGDSALHKMLFNIFGNARLSDLNVPVLVPAYQKDANKGVFFSNIEHPICFGKNSKIIDVARATSAAPIYLPPYSFDGRVYIDGGFFCNNPTLIALFLVNKSDKKPWILSLGTGLKKDL